MIALQHLQIRKQGRSWSIFSGRVRLAKGFKTWEAAEADALENFDFYQYWAQSAGVSIQNTAPVIIDAR